MTRYEVLQNAVLAVIDKARTIFPPNDVHGIDHVQQHLGVTYTEKQLIEFVDLLWPDAVLRACAGTHVLVAGFPLSIGEMRTQRPDLFCWSFREDIFEDPFARDVRVGTRWHLIRKSPVPDSSPLGYKKQQLLLSRDEGVPLACELVYALVLHYLATGERLLADNYVRCANPDAPHCPFMIGGFWEGGMLVDACSDGSDGISGLGVASALKYP